MAGHVGRAVPTHHSTLADRTMVGSENPPCLLATVRDYKLVIRRNWPEGEDRVKGAFAIARDLAKLVTEARKAA